MNLRNYYHNRFANHLAQMVVKHSPQTLGYITQYEMSNPASGVASLPIKDRPRFVLCLFFTVLVDQAMYSYGPKDGVDFKTLARYPQWGVLGGANSNPWGIISVALDEGYIKEKEVTDAADEAMRLFVDETVDYFVKHLPRHSPKEFLSYMISDPDISDAVLLRAGLAGMALLGSFRKIVSKLD